MSNERILLVDDDDSFRRIVEYNLREEDYQVTMAGDGLEALEIFKQQPFDLIVSDVKMPGMDGIELLAQVKQINPDAMVVIVTAFGSVETAVDAMKKGAFDYVTKPFNRDDFKQTVARALKLRTLQEENISLREQLTDRFSFKSIIGASAAMSRVFKTMSRLVQSDATILIQGESGTGKELVARALHANGSRAAKRFMAVNCSAIPAPLLESELFGHVKGAFTGAERDREGRFKAADGGTIFLDEIGDMPAELQAKMLRVLQEREVEPVGSNDSIPVDVRVIAATNRDLVELVKEGAFREDLYYRLNVIPIRLPPLRERVEDIPLLVRNALEKMGEKRLKVGADVMKRLSAFSWPGNVRELQNVMERAATLRENDDRLTVDDLPELVAYSGSESQASLLDIPEDGIVLDDVEKGLIVAALRKTNGNQTRAAQLLGVTRHTLIYRLEKYGIDPRNPGEESET